MVSAEDAPQINIHEAKTHLSRLVERVEKGEEIVISRAGTPAARLVPLARAGRRRSLGMLRGRIRLAEDWDTPETGAQIAREFGIDDGPASRQQA